VGLIGAARLRDVAKNARLREVADARQLLAESDRLYQSILDEPETFTSWEEHSGTSADEPAG
jgi:hypothetical protein